MSSSAKKSLKTSFSVFLVSTSFVLACKSGSPEASNSSTLDANQAPISTSDFNTESGVEALRTKFKLPRFIPNEKDYTILSLRSLESLLKDQKIGECQFSTANFKIEKPRGGDYEDLKVVEKNSGKKFQIQQGLTLAFLAEQELLLSKKTIPVGSENYYTLNHLGDIGFFGNDRLSFTIFLEESGKAVGVQAAQISRSYRCAGLNLGIICLGIGGVVTDENANAKKLLTCGKTAQSSKDLK